MLLAILGVITSLMPVVMAIVKYFNDKHQEGLDVKKEISDAVASGDLSRINAAVGKLRR